MGENESSQPLINWTGRKTSDSCLGLTSRTDVHSAIEKESHLKCLTQKVTFPVFLETVIRIMVCYEPFPDLSQQATEQEIFEYTTSLETDF